MTGLPQARPQLVDFHCHVDLYQDHIDLLAECDSEGIATLAVTTTPKAWPRNRDLASKTKHVRVALGLHPQLVAERAHEVPILERYLQETRYVGEIGLDAGPRFYRNFSDQERVFETILRACAEQRGKILTVHSVRSATKVLDHLERSFPPDAGKVILHWFTGTTTEARRAIAHGCYFSINSEMLLSPKHRELVKILPRERLLTETDGPFVLRDGKPVRPKHVKDTIAALAALRDENSEVTRILILDNLRRLVLP